MRVEIAQKCRRPKASDIPHCCRLRDKSIIFLLDPERVQKVTDFYGHEARDELPKGIAAQISALISPAAVVVRLGGDKFAFCLTSEDACVGTITLRPQALFLALYKPYPIGDTEGCIGVSIGISMRECLHEHATASHQRVDVALYKAKRLGRDVPLGLMLTWNWCAMSAHSWKRQFMPGSNGGEFIPHFQSSKISPLCASAGSKYSQVGNVREKGALGPDRFLGMVEGCSLIAELSLTAMCATLSQAVHWPPCRLWWSTPHRSIKAPRSPTASSSIFVRMAEGQQTDAAYGERTRSWDCPQIARRGRGGRPGRFRQRLRRDRAVRDMPFDRPKIDRKFLVSLRRDQEAHAFVRAIATLGKKLLLPITAQGIEEQRIQDLLVAPAATDGQGWLYGEVLPIDDVARK